MQVAISCRKARLGTALRRWWLASGLILIWGGCAFALSTPARARSQKLSLPVHFEAAAPGPAYGFIGHGGGYSLSVSTKAAVLFLRPHFERNHGALHGNRAARATPVRAVSMELVGANPQAKLEAQERLPARINYFVGNDPARWRFDVASYSRIVERNAWPGVDLVYYGNQDRLECDFIVRAGGDPARVRLALDGADRARVEPNGALLLTAGSAEIRLLKPRVYQSIAGRMQTVKAGYRVMRRDGRVAVGFNLGRYDRQQPLTIDPVLAYSSYLGGSGRDRGLAIALDGSRRVYVAGSTGSNDFPMVGAAQSHCPACPKNDAFVAEFNPALPGAQSLVYATYLGGSGTGDSATAIAIDSAGKIYVAGETTSGDFPTTSNALLGSCPTGGGSGSCTAAFVTELDPAAAGKAQLVYSTYLGGSTFDAANAIAVPQPGTVYVAGATSSSDFPVTPGAFQGTCNDCSPPATSAFVAQLNTNASGPASLMYATFLGGSTSDVANALAVPFSNAIWIAGATASSDFPVTSNAFEGTCPACANSATNAFVALLSPLFHQPTEPQLVYSTYLGGSGNSPAGDIASGIAVHGTEVDVTGTTSSTDFPTTPPAAFRNVCPSQSRFGGCQAAFLTTLIPIAPPAQQLVYSTYLGGKTGGGDSGTGIAVDDFGDAYVIGTTASPDFPVTRNAAQKSCANKAQCISSAFVAKFDPQGYGPSSLQYSSYLGGSGSDHGAAIAVDGNGHAWVAGTTSSTDFPTKNAFAAANAGGATDAFVTGLNLFPTASVLPKSLDFGKAVIFGANRQQKTLFVTVHNSSSRKHGMALQFSGYYPAVTGGFLASSCNGTRLLAPGQTCQVGVTFAPAGVGRQSGTLTLKDNSSAGQHVIALSGVGVQGRVSITPAAGLSFGARAVGTSSRPKFVTLLNRYPIPMGIQGVSIINDPAHNFRISSDGCSGAVHALSRCRIGIAFAPTAKGPARAKLQLADDAARSPQLVSLSGAGK